MIVIPFDRREGSPRSAAPRAAGELDGRRPDRPRHRWAFSPAQCRAARGFLDWSREELARRAGLTFREAENYETNSDGFAIGEIDKAVDRAFSRAGVIPVEAGKYSGPGVRFRFQPRDD